MDVKKDILWRVYLGFIIMALVGVTIIGKAVVIQQVEGNYWRSMSDSRSTNALKNWMQNAERSIAKMVICLAPAFRKFDIYIDFYGGWAKGEEKEKGLKKILTRFSYCLSIFF